MSETADLFGRYTWGVTRVGATFVYYEKVDEWRPEQRPGPAGGTLTLQIRTGRQVWRACVLYADPAQPLAIAGEVLAAIEADQLHLKTKHHAI